MSASTPVPTQRLRASGRLRLLLLAISTVLMLGLTECALRLALPPTAFRDPDSDEFWIVRLRAVPPEQLRYAEDTIYDAQLGWRGKPGFSRDDAHHNSRGARALREHAELKSPGTQRIVTLGDSFTWGFGVADEQTYSAELEALLPNSEVINLGVNGYGTDQQVLLWEQEGASYRPDLVLLGLFVHDFHRNGQAIYQYPKPYFVVDPQAPGGLRSSGVPVPPLEEIFDDDLFVVAGRSRLADAARFGWDKLARRLGWLDPAVAHGREVAVTQLLLERLHQSTHAAGAQLVVAVLPAEPGDSVRDAAFIAKFVVEACTRLSVPVHDLTGHFDERTASGETLFDGAHWNARGHELAAAELARYLDSAGFVAGAGLPDPARDE